MLQVSTILGLLILVGLLCISSVAQGGDRPCGRMFATRSEVLAQNGMAATSQPLATQAAIDILKQGGNAIDAAIAANAVLGVVEPMSCGIGGDLFVILWDNKSKQLHGLNASGRSPYGLTLDELRSKGLKEIPVTGPIAVSVPGCIDGWFTLHEKFGKLPMKDILAPAIHYAEQGFPVTEVIASYWATPDRVKDQPGFAKTYLPGGKPPAKGDIFRNPDLAKTYRILAEEGRDAFYKGKLADKLDTFFKQHNGYLRKKDFEDHQATWVQPVSTSYRGYDVWELPPNGQGIAVLQMLNILEGFDLAKMGHNSADYLHHLIEAKKLAYEDRAKFYADPAFNNLPTEELISKPYAAKRRDKLNPTRAADSYPPGDPKLDHGDTVYLTVADKDRNMVSFIQSTYWGFGSGVVPADMGFTLQNRGSSFTLEEDHYNVYQPHKRPFHTIIPGFVTRDDKPWMSFGVMGGAMQPQGQVQVLCNIIDFNMNLQEAGDAARFRHSGSSQPTGESMTTGGRVYLESGITPEVRRDLSAKGHSIRTTSGSYGGYQAIRYDAERGIYIAASESRKDGHAAGY